eukprot:COSAG06_NODE_1832_length_8261_cov_31.690112_5_plen_101_part_00
MKPLPSGHPRVDRASPPIESVRTAKPRHLSNLRRGKPCTAIGGAIPCRAFVHIQCASRNGGPEPGHGGPAAAPQGEEAQEGEEAEEEEEAQEGEEAEAKR